MCLTIFIEKYFFIEWFVNIWNRRITKKIKQGKKLHELSESDELFVHVYQGAGGRGEIFECKPFSHELTKQRAWELRKSSLINNKIFNQKEQKVWL